MDFISNAFSILELDADDNRVNTAPSSSASSKPKSVSTTNNTGKSKKKGNNGNIVVKKEKQNEENLVKSSENSSNIVVKKEKQIEKNLVKSSEKYKMPLVWIDLEMTGLKIEFDRILEIACIITDGNLTKSVEGPDLVIHQSKECLDQMGEWCRSHHAASGLTNKVLQSKVSEREAEKQVVEFVRKHVDVGAYTPLLAGNSVYVDLMYLKKYMPELASLFSHVVVDVSSVKALCMRWYPRDQKKAPQKENRHRALDDIKESIRELKFYRETIFKPMSKK